jgi:O-succinylbenzoate synthase
MKLKTVELREIRLPLIHFFETSFGRTTERRILLVRVVEEGGAEGWGECTAGEGPFYSDEWIDSSWATLFHFLAPMVVGQQIQKAGEVWPFDERSSWSPDGKSRY